MLCLYYLIWYYSSINLVGELLIMAYKKVFNLRITDAMYEKLKVIADAEKRSLNSQLEYFLEKCIKDYEEKK